jgi:2-(1,2-epoxy-1,2-dihydrophenyl)acetyl-CoA isomerase
MSEAEHGTVDLRHEGAAAWITLNRPARLNAFAGTMRDDLHAALVAAGRRADTRVVVITGAGRAFCAGADVETMGRLLRDDDSATFGGYVEAGMRVVQQIRALPCPVVAAVNGVAVGAGASLAAACDIRIAAQGASIGFTFNRIGLHPDWGATYFLPRLVGLGRAMELISSARILSSDEAERIGFLSRVVPNAEFEKAVEALVRELADKPPQALAAAKRSLDISPEASLSEMLEIEREAQLRLFASEDVHEGIAAFHEKRTASFRGL